MSNLQRIDESEPCLIDPVLVIHYLPDKKDVTVRMWVSDLSSQFCKRAGRRLNYHAQLADHDFFIFEHSLGMDAMKLAVKEFARFLSRAVALEFGKFRILAHVSLLDEVWRYRPTEPELKIMAHDCRYSVHATIPDWQQLLRKDTTCATLALASSLTRCSCHAQMRTRALNAPSGFVVPTRSARHAGTGSVSSSDGEERAET
eukprot:2829759-Amphidinium_carterae.2